MSRLTLFALLLPALLLGACSEDAPVTPKASPPEVCFRMSIDTVINSRCRYEYTFQLNPLCTTDAETAVDDLELRWDFDNDGEWDTDFGPIAPTFQASPDPSLDAWEVRAEVRDGDGETTIAIESFPLISFPKGPDMIAGDICIRSNPSIDQCRSTVTSGEEFEIWAFSTCFGDFSETEQRFVVWLDGRIIGQATGSCSGDLYGCNGIRLGLGRLWTPGEYQLVLDVDYDDAIEEFNEVNNTSLMTLTVVSR